MHGVEAAGRSRELKALFKPRVARSPLVNADLAYNSSPEGSSVYWPEEYLASDLSQARVWTYGYNADVIGGLFQANNKNSISQHGRDLSVRLERDLEKEVRYLQQPTQFICKYRHSLIKYFT